MFKQTFIAATLAAASVAASANGNGSILFAEPGGSFNFTSVSFNGTSGQILNLTIDLTGTANDITFGGLLSINTTLLNGGTAALFGAEGDQVFGFDFTGYDSYEVFSFGWDPDRIGDGSYGAVTEDLVGAYITAVVDFNGTLVTYADTVEMVGPDAAANLVPVPEPETYALMLAGLSAVGFMARRQSKR